MKPTKYNEIPKGTINYFKYNFESGVLYKSADNSPCGYVSDNGYIMVNYKRTLYRAHRICWFLHYKIQPKMLDHKNRNKLDNRIKNLRECTKSQNAINSKKRINNKSGVTGVYFDKSINKWRAKMMVCGKNINLGIHKDIDLAITARKKAEVKYHGEFMNKEDMINKALHNAHS